MQDLLDDYGERRKRELFEQGSVAASAHHDPKTLNDLRPATVEDQGDSLYTTPAGA